MIGVKPSYAPLFPYLAARLNAPILAPGELIVDNFAGGGGASTGIEMALGRPVDIAINHDPEALAMHAANHPYTDHHCESVWDVDPRAVTAGRPVALAWFSPDCKHFSKAKGGKPVSKQVRGLAWVALRWAATVRPRVICVENVEEFKTWGPLGPDNKPDKKQSGRTFQSWVNALKRHGYVVEWRELKACDYGAPTTRKRLFIVARCDGLPIVWPQQTHGAPTDARVLSGQLLPWRTAAECMDWDLPVRSVFGRKKPLVAATMRRISQGILRYTLQAQRPFVVTCNHTDKTFRGWGIDEPTKTLTGANEAHGLVGAALVKIDNQKSWASCTYDPQQPLPTIVTKNGFALATAVLVPQTHENPPRPVDAPMSTVTTQSNAHTLVGAMLVPRYGERQGQRPRVQDIQRPLPTVVTTENGSRMAVAHITKFRANSIGTAMDEPLHTITAGGKRSGPGSTFGVVSVQIVKNNGGHLKPRNAGRAIDLPLATITAQGGKPSLTTAALVQYNGTATAQSVDAPIPTLCTVERFGLMTAQFDRQFKSGRAHGADEPARTVMTQGGGKTNLVITSLTPDLTPEQLAGARQVYHLLSTELGAALGPYADHAQQLVLVSIDGETHVMTDIGMRMLTPRELYRAQSFPESYLIDFSVKGKPLPKDSQVRMCGNAVPPVFSQALALANLSVARQEAAD